ncbi:hypothetical protein IDAT_02690 [Pseudidiomarina atlantica]|jgi:uncharacterized protein YbaR (Trm112 family)|uniref:UPF0434 protein IDAT_02690 n=1 Tax=Pseudidiomarina atlantica TaxID=1517416 RepID=A0A094JBP5_9GAMM|nr:Trm112 family protein [Pseudidiomarina atlantica]KFZ30006.1 hypothetical protein IDAT_02690 [Pseudidiomarina atlantica]
MTLDERTLALLVCPLCKGKLIWQAEAQELICRGDRLAYPVRNQIPHLLESAARQVSADELEQLPK